MIAPIIIPISHVEKVNCIIENNTQYCESKNMTKQELGYGLIVITLLILWSMSWIALWIEKDEPILALIVFFAPIIIVIIYCLI